MAQDTQAIDMEVALERASDSERASLQEVRSLLGTADWLEGQSGSDALTEIDNVEFEIERILSDACGVLGSAFKRSQEYKDGKQALEALREQHRVPLRAEPAVGVAVPTARTVGVVANPLGFYNELLPLINNSVLQDPRNFNVLIAGLRGEAAKSDDEPPWKAAALGLYNRLPGTSPVTEMPSFEDAWFDWYDRRLDAPRVIGHYARLSDQSGFLAMCREKLFPALKPRAVSWRSSCVITI